MTAADFEVRSNDFGPYAGAPFGGLLAIGQSYDNTIYFSSKARGKYIYVVRKTN